MIDDVTIQYIDGEYYVYFEHIDGLKKQYDEVSVERVRLIRDTLDRRGDWIMLVPTFFKKGVTNVWIKGVR